MDMGFFNQKKTPFNSAEVNHGIEDSVRYPPLVDRLQELQELRKFERNLIKEMLQ